MDVARAAEEGRGAGAKEELKRIGKRRKKNSGGCTLSTATTSANAIAPGSGGDTASAKSEPSSLKAAAPTFAEARGRGGC